MDGPGLRVTRPVSSQGKDFTDIATCGICLEIIFLKGRMMLGTISLIALFVLGFMAMPWWLVVPFAVINTFIGAHFPAGKAQMFQERGQYWQLVLSSLPLQAVFAAIVFGIGYGVGLLFA
jgi:hypothetical protein